MRLFSFLSFFFIPLLGLTQNVVTDSLLNRTSSITYTEEGSQISFTPQTPPLQQIAGAPKAFYSYYWEFGDGNYSKEKKPSHSYKKPGEYEIRLWATNHYDTGKPPTTRPTKITVSQTDESVHDQASMTQDFELQINRDPIPEEEIVLVMSYRNYKSYTTNGRLYLFYNERKFKASNFELVETRAYHNEKQPSNPAFAYTGKSDRFENTLWASTGKTNVVIEKSQDTTEKSNLPLTLQKAESYYKNWSILEFDNMEPNEERNLFFSLKTTPEMIKDTSAIISVRGVYVPDVNYDNHKVKDVEMEIVTSHDPNKMSSNGTLMNYRIVRFKTLKYKIKFQNNGEGPARTIRLETDIPEMLDKSTLEVMAMYPKVPICPKEQSYIHSCLDTTYTSTQAIFTFKNIYLPGSEQKNVKDYDSTKGFVKYKIKFAKDFHKKKTKSRTAIIFDKNEPIITNYSTTRFSPGISVGVKAGYNSFTDLKNSENYFIGVTVSPYKSYRWYWQVELLNDFHNYDGNTHVDEVFIDGPQGFPLLQRTTTNSSYKNIDWDVPLLVRYNLNNYIGFGAGLQGTITVSEKEKQNILEEQYMNEGPDLILIDSQETTMEVSNSFTNLRTGLLVDITAGFSRIGPSLGVRYIMDFETKFNHWQFYAIWKF